MSLKGELGGLRSAIEALLRKADYPGLVELAKGRRPTVRMLISMSYDKSGLLGWRAMEAIGKITAGWPVEKARNIIQRLLWMLREESGSNPWSSGEIIAEIVRENPAPFEDIVPVVISFHEEKFLRASALRAMARIAEVRADLVEPFEEVALGYLDSEDPAERGHALLALKGLGKKRYLPAVERRFKDNAPFRFYDGAAIVEVPIKSLARETASALRS